MWNYIATFVTCFITNICRSGALTTELSAMIWAIDHAEQEGWSKLWIESSLILSIKAIRNNNLVLWIIRNQWLNSICIFFGLSFSSALISKEKGTHVRISLFFFFFTFN